ncbi:MAG: hypothetical protein ASARMPREDX12_009117 [Alectoria sarmentosa]|nr:MAG: hypothetical protein ASARMPREDX12_009117 [Alectoria sarmentosa]
MSWERRLGKQQAMRANPASSILQYRPRVIKSDHKYQPVSVYSPHATYALCPPLPSQKLFLRSGVHPLATETKDGEDKSELTAHTAAIRGLVELTIEKGRNKTTTSVRKSEIENPSRAMDVLKQRARVDLNDSQNAEKCDPQMNTDKCGNPKSSVGCRGDKYATVEEDEAELGEAQGQWLYHEEDIFNLSQC